MSEVWNYRADQELPSWAGEWLDGNEAVLNLASGWTFTAFLVDDVKGTVAATVSSGIVGAAVSPNIIVPWATGLLATALGSSSVPRDYRLHVRATSAGGDRFYRPGNEDVIRISPVPL